MCALGGVSLAVGIFRRVIGLCFFEVCLLLEREFFCRWEASRGEDSRLHCAVEKISGTRHCTGRRFCWVEKVLHKGKSSRKFNARLRKGARKRQDN